MNKTVKAKSTTRKRTITKSKVTKVGKKLVRKTRTAKKS